MMGLLVRLGGPAILLAVWGTALPSFCQEPPVSEATQACIDCHSDATPVLVADWKRSRHSKITPSEALKKPELERRVSAGKIPDALAGVVVGCAECHALNPSTHKDTFDHNDQKVHLTVTPKDCSTCHQVESEQYDKNMMSWARVNLEENPWHQKLMKAINGPQSFKGMKTTVSKPDPKTNDESCYSCHGTALEVKGTRTKDTDYGKLEFPVLSGWPNQGVGRFNTDGSKGSCTPCHSRHEFGIQTARKPYSCAQCHRGPDVPVYGVYSASRHGALFTALQGEWNFKEVPWTIGKDFTAPTCAVCHVSLVATPDGSVIANRTHQMSDRIPWRIFGLIYSHPHPKSPDTAIIKNADNVPLPVTLGGRPATDFLIDEQEQTVRRKNIQKVCLSCHTADWVDGHWDRFLLTLKTTNDMTLTATQIITKAWDEKVADNTDPFDEGIEKQWTEEWLFYANSTRFASAMMGADHGAFDEGRWQMSKNLQDMLDHLHFLVESKKKRR